MINAPNPGSFQANDENESVSRLLDSTQVVVKPETKAKRISRKLSTPVDLKPHDETAIPVEENLSRENYKARRQLFSVMEPNWVDVPPSTIDTEELKRKYMDYCKKIGTMDCDNDIKEEVKRVTKKYLRWYDS